MYMYKYRAFSQLDGFATYLPPETHPHRDTNTQTRATYLAEGAEVVKLEQRILYKRKKRGKAEYNLSRHSKKEPSQTGAGVTTAKETQQEGASDRNRK